MEKELEQLLDLLDGMEKRVTPAGTFFTGRLVNNAGGIRPLAGARVSFASEYSGAPLEIVAHQCGIGKVNAAIGASALIRDFAPDAIVSTGVAGGATTLVPRLEVVASTEVAYHDVYCFTDNAYGQIQGLPPRFPSDARLVEAARGIEGVHPGLIASGDWFVDTKEKAGFILDHFPDALAIDMESGAIAHVCHRFAVPFISFRIISDIPLASDRGEQYFDFWDRVAKGSFRVLLQFLGRVAS